MKALADSATNLLCNLGPVLCLYGAAVTSDGPSLCVEGARDETGTQSVLQSTELNTDARGHCFSPHCTMSSAFELPFSSGSPPETIHTRASHPPQANSYLFPFPLSTATAEFWPTLVTRYEIFPRDHWAECLPAFLPPSKLPFLPSSGIFASADGASFMSWRSRLSLMWWSLRHFGKLCSLEILVLYQTR